MSNHVHATQRIKRSSFFPKRNVRSVRGPLKLTSIVTLGILLSACTKKAGRSAAVQNVRTTESAESCEFGTQKVVFGVRAPGGAFRLSVCSNYSDRAYITELFVQNDQQGATIFSRKQITKEKGLHEALFGSVDNLLIEAKNDSDTLTVTGSEQSILVVKLGKGLELKGRINFGDPLNACFGSEGGLEHRRVEIHAGTAQMNAEICTGNMGTSGGFSYDVVGLEINDANPNLSMPISAKLTGAEFTSRVQVKINHHNVCDTLIVKFDQAVYAITNVGGIGDALNCPLPAEAPKLLNRNQARYRNTYGSKTEEGHLPFANYYRL